MFRLHNTHSLVKSIAIAILLIGMAIIVVLSPKYLALNTDSRSRAAFNDRKPITGTFFMADFISPSPTVQREMVKEMANTGIDTIILLAAGVLEKNGFGYKETVSMTMSNSMYRTILPLAHEFNMKVYVGLASADYQKIPYWVGSPTDPNTDQGRLIDFSLRLIDATKLAAQQQNVPWDTIAGFYIPIEAGPAHFNDPNSNEITFYKRLSQAVKQKEPNKKILLSPWLLEDATYDQVKMQYTNLLASTAIDILAPQDSMGSQKVTSYGRDADHFRALHDAVSQFPGREAWANIETQLQPSASDGNYNPSTITRVQAQIAAAKPHVTKMITWIYQHTMLSHAAFDNTYSWTGQYTPARAAARKALRQAYMNTYINATPTTTPSLTPSPIPSQAPCSSRYYCDTTSYTCVKTSATYNVLNKQCNNLTVTCQANLTTYLPGKTTGTCFTSLSGCQSGCIRPSTTASPTPRATSMPTATGPSTTTIASPAPTHISTSTPQAGSTSTPTPIPTPAPVIENVFFYYDNLVIKGKNFGPTGSTPLVTITYGFKQFSDRRQIIQEEKQVIYIGKSLVPGFDPAGQYTITITP